MGRGPSKANDLAAAERPASGCDGDPSAANADAPLLDVDCRLDMREVEHDQRHALVLSAVEGLAPGDVVVLIAAHAPRPVLAEISDRFGAQIGSPWLKSGPQVWQIRLERSAVPPDSPTGTTSADDRPRCRDQRPYQTGCEDGTLTRGLASFRPRADDHRHRRRE